MTSESQERRLVERAARGDRQAFGMLYQQYVDMVYSYVAFRVRDRNKAEDLTQDVFVQALRGLDGFDWRGSLAPWLMSIARNTVIDHWRRTGRRPERPFSQTEMGDDDESDRRLDRLVDERGEVDVERAESAADRERLLRAVDRLTDLQRQVVALRFGSGLSIRETADVMDRSEGAIKNLQHHAVRAMRRTLADLEEMDGPSSRAPARDEGVSA